jgi:hypothetical protein
VKNKGRPPTAEIAYQIAESQEGFRPQMRIVNNGKLLRAWRPVPPAGKIYETKQEALDAIKQYRERQAAKSRVIHPVVFEDE